MFCPQINECFWQGASPCANTYWLPSDCTVNNHCSKFQSSWSKHRKYKTLQTLLLNLTTFPLDKEHSLMSDGALDCHSGCRHFFVFPALMLICCVTGGNLLQVFLLQLLLYLGQGQLHLVVTLQAVRTAWSLSAIKDYRLWWVRILIPKGNNQALTCSVHLTFCPCLRTWRRHEKTNHGTKQGDLVYKNYALKTTAAPVSVSFCVLEITGIVQLWKTLQDIEVKTILQGQEKRSVCVFLGCFYCLSVHCCRWTFHASMEDWTFQSHSFPYLWRP